MSTTVEKMMTRSGVSISVMKMGHFHTLSLWDGRIPDGDLSKTTEMLVTCEEEELRELAKMIKKHLPKKKKKKKKSKEPN